MDKKEIYKKLAILSILAIFLKDVPDDMFSINYIPHFGFGNTDEYDDLITDSFNIKNKRDYIPQGLCVLEDKILTTLYNKNPEVNSIISITDRETKDVKIVRLNSASHSGGICYDPVNKNIWISHIGGSAACYKLEDILNDNYVYPINIVNCSNGLDNYKGTQSIAYMCYNDGHLYVGNFNILGQNTIMKEYKIDEDNLIYNKTYKMPNYVQGVAFLEGKMIVSRSYGPMNSSEIMIYDDISKSLYNNDDYTIERGCSIETHSLQQQIQVVGDELFVLTESNSIIFDNCLTNTDDINVIEIDKLFEKVKKR